MATAHTPVRSTRNGGEADTEMSRMSDRRGRSDRDAAAAVVVPIQHFHIPEDDDQAQMDGRMQPTLSGEEEEEEEAAALAAHRDGPGLRRVRAPPDDQAPAPRNSRPPANITAATAAGTVGAWVASASESRALVALCGADLHALSTTRSLDTHPLLREQPNHITFNAFPMLVMGLAWACQAPQMLFTVQPWLMLLLPLAYALALLIACVVMSWRFPSWVMDHYHSNPLDAIMRINTHSNSLVNADDEFEKEGIKNDSASWATEKVQLAVKLRERAKQKLLRREQVKLEDKVKSSESEIEALKLKQQRYTGVRADMSGDPTTIVTKLQELRDQRQKSLLQLNSVNEKLEEQSLFADYKLVPTYFSVFFLVGFVTLSVLIAISNAQYGRSVVLPCRYHDSLSTHNITTLNGTAQTAEQVEQSFVFDKDLFKFQLVNVTSSDPVNPAACLVAQSVRFSWLLFWALVTLVQLTLAWHVTSQQDAEMRESQLQMRLAVEPRLMAQIVHFIKAQHWERQTLPSDPLRQGGAITLALLAPVIQLVVMLKWLVHSDVPGLVLYVACLPVGCVAAYTIQYMMYGLSIIYWRNQRYMLMCTRLMERFNLVRSSELLFSWWHVRELFRRVLMPVGYSLGAWGLTALLLLTVSAVLIVVVVIFVAPEGIRVFFADPTLVLFLALAVIALIILFRILIHAVSVYEEQQRHVEVMQRALLINHDDIAVRLRTHFLSKEHADEDELGQPEQQESARLLTNNAWAPLSHLPPTAAAGTSPAARTSVGGDPSIAGTATGWVALQISPASASTAGSCFPSDAAASSILGSGDPLVERLKLYSKDGFFGTLRFVHALSRGYLWPELNTKPAAAPAATAKNPAQIAPAESFPTHASTATAAERRGEFKAGVGAGAGAAMGRGQAFVPSRGRTTIEKDAQSRRRLQVLHARQVLQRQQEQAKLHLLDSSGSVSAAACDWGPSEQRDVVASFSTLIRESDTFPAVLGIPIKPTLLQLVSGYVVSAAVLVAGKFVSQIGF